MAASGQRTAVTATVEGVLREALAALDDDDAERLRRAAGDLADRGLEREAQGVLRVRERVDRHRRREAELVALQETARDLIRLRDVDQVLQAIVRRARQLLATDVGYLSIYDPRRRDFYVRATEGAVSEDFRRIRVPQDVGICGAVARTRLPQLSSSYAEDRRFAHDGAIDTGVLAEDIVSLLGVPLLVDGDVIGVLFVASRSERRFSPQQIALLDSLGAHAAVGIENARLFQEAAEALRDAESANRELRERTAEVQEAAEVHERLTSLLTEGGDLDDVASVVAASLGGRVEVLDEQLRPLASSDPASTSGAADPRAANALRPSWRRAAQLGRAVEVAERDAWVASLGDADHPYGLLVLLGAGPLSQPQLRTLERAAMLATLVLVARERVAAAEHRAASDVAAALLRGSGDDPEAIAAVAREHDLVLDRPTALVLNRVEGLRPALAADAARRALRGLPALPALHDDDLVVIADADEAGAVAASLRSVLAERAATVTSVRCRPVRSPAGLPEAFRRGRRCLRLLTALGRTGELADEGDLAPYAALLGDQPPGELREMVSGRIGPLLDHDRARGTELVRTLLTYLDQGLRTQPAAAALHLHPNTLRQRLDRVSRLLPDWDDPVRRLEVHLALRVHQLLGDRTDQIA